MPIAGWDRGSPTVLDNLRHASEYLHTDQAKQLRYVFGTPNNT